MSCFKPKFWINDVTVLFKHKYLFELWPYEDLSYESKLNAATRFIIVITLLGYMALNNFVILLLGIVLILSLVILYKFQNGNSEGFNSANNEQYTTNVSSRTNPLKNVLLTDYDDNVNKMPATTVYDTTEEDIINTKTKEFIMENNKNNHDIHKVFDSLGDQKEFENSMRQFYVNPSTTIPNSQGDFLSYCYGELPSEKPLVVH